MSTSIKKTALAITLILTSFTIFSCENESNSPTKPLTSTTYGTVSGTVYFLGTVSTVPGVLVTCGDVSSTTSNDGKFTLRNIPTGSQTLKATKNDFNPYSRNIEVAENTVSTFDIEMTAASTNKSLRGVVYQKDNLATLPDVRVMLVNDTTYSDAFGRYQLPIISQGLKTLKAEKTGYVTLVKQVFISNSDIQFDITLEKIP